jgi:phosphoribosylglycinamide formyltransferase 1
VAKLKLAVLLSGSGTTLENLFEQRDLGKLDVDIVCVLGSRADAYGLERARKRNVPALVVERKKFKDPQSFSAAIFNAITPYRPDAIALAGFMCLLCIPPQYHGKVLNIHPSLLPDFGGKGFY